MDGLDGVMILLILQKQGNLNNENKLWVKILYILTLITQVGIVIGTFVVEYLTNKKAGVMHHVYYRRYQFENGIFHKAI